LPGFREAKVIKFASENIIGSEPSKVPLESQNDENRQELAKRYARRPLFQKRKRGTTDPGALRDKLGTEISTQPSQLQILPHLSQDALVLRK
jgi:hypothetical protein